MSRSSRPRGTRNEDASDPLSPISGPVVTKIAYPTSNEQASWISTERAGKARQSYATPPPSSSRTHITTRRVSTSISHPVKRPSPQSPPPAQPVEPARVRDSIATTCLASLPPAPDDVENVWERVRSQKERLLVKEKDKVDFTPIDLDELDKTSEARNAPSTMLQLEEAAPPESHHSRHPKRTKSISNFRESSDGKTIIASFDLRGVPVEDVQLQLRPALCPRSRSNIFLTWATAELAEWEEDGVMYRDRMEVICQRTVPLPEGATIKDVYAAMHNGYLVMRYPNMRCIKYESSKS